MNNNNIKIGICFGGYNPMHQGHLDTIMKAKKECDYTFVVVCGYDNEPRAIVPFHLKTDIIAEFVENTLNTLGSEKLVRCISINDTELGIDESESEKNWDIWLNAVFDKINHHCKQFSVGMKMTDDPIQVDKTNVRFYVGEQRYVDALTKRNIYAELVGIDKDGRRINHISATAIRNNPVMYWNKIINPFRPYMTKKILITGTASEGKSTLTKDLATYFDTTFVTEKAKDILSNCRKPEMDLNVDDYVNFLNNQYYGITGAMYDSQNKGFIFADTDNLVTLMYAKSYSKIPDFVLKESDYEQIKNYYEQNLDHTNKWDKIFLITPHGKFVDDGIRYMGQAGLDERFKNFNILIELLKDYDMFDKVVFLSGTYYENFIMIRDYVNENILQQ